MRGRFFVTPSAVEDYCDIMELDAEREAVFAGAQKALIERSELAKLKRTRDDGMELWRLSGKPRLYLVVSRKSEGTLPAVIQVLPEHGRG